MCIDPNITLHVIIKSHGHLCRFYFFYYLELHNKYACTTYFLLHERRARNYTTSIFSCKYHVLLRLLSLPRSCRIWSPHMFSLLPSVMIITLMPSCICLSYWVFTITTK